MRGEQVAVTSKKQAPYSKYQALCSDRGRRRWRGNGYLMQSEQRAICMSSKFGNNKQHTSSNVLPTASGEWRTKRNNYQAVRENRTTRSEERVKDSKQQNGATSNKLSTAKSKQRRANNVEQTASDENQADKRDWREER